MGIQALFRRHVGFRIIVFYLIALSLLATVGMLAISRLNHLNALLSAQTDNLTRERALTDKIVQQTLLARLYVSRYIRTQSQQDQDLFDKTYAGLQDLLAQADSQITDPQRVEMLTRIKSAIQAYGTTFEQITQLIRRQQQTRAEVLDVQALAIEGRLTAIRVYLATADDPALFLAFGNAQNAFQLLRLYVSQYLVEGDESYAVLANSAYQQARNALTDLAQNDSDPVQRHDILAAQAALESYYQGVQSIREDYAALRTQLTTVQYELEPTIAAAASTIAASVDQAIEAQNATTRTLTKQTRLLTAMAVLVTYLLVLGLGTHLTRQITDPLQQVVQRSQHIAKVDLRALTDQLHSLSHGDLRLHLDVTVEPLALAREDELGQMAAAFDTIIASLHEARQAFEAMVAYLNEMASAATSVAQGNLDVEVAVRSNQDVLGQAVSHMLANLRAARDNIKRQLERLAALRDIDTLIATSLDLRQVLSFLLERTVALLSVAAAEILLFDPVTQKLQRFVQTDRALDLDQDKTQRCADLVWREAQPVAIHDAAAEAGHPLIAYLPADVRAYFSWPLLAQGQVKGVLQMFHPAPIAPEEEWLNFAATLAGQAAIAIEHIQLIEGLERRVAERTAELEVQKEEVKRFAYIVSHDLRAPLVNMKGFSSELVSAIESIRPIVNELLPQLDTEKQEMVRQVVNEDIPEALEFITSSVNRMDHFINALLKLSRLGRRDLIMEPVDVNEVVKATLKALAHQIEERQVEVTVGPLPTIIADKTAIEQIIANLLDNAVKYLEPGRPGKIAITAEQDSEKTTFHVRDNGRGIAASDMDKVFAPFRRAGRQDVPGEGMGLPYVQTLVRRLGGEITCESVLGEGSTFTFTISRHLG